MYVCISMCMYVYIYIYTCGHVYEASTDLLLCKWRWLLLLAYVVYVCLFVVYMLAYITLFSLLLLSSLLLLLSLSIIMIIILLLSLLLLSMARPPPTPASRSRPRRPRRSSERDKWGQWGPANAPLQPRTAISRPLPSYDTAPAELERWMNEWTNGVTAFFVMFVDRGAFWVLPLTYFVYLPESARAYLLPQSVEINYFCSGPISVKRWSHLSATKDSLEAAIGKCAGDTAGVDSDHSICNSADFRVTLITRGTSRL